MLEKIFFIFFVSIVFTLMYWNNETYNKDLREHFYCTPYDIEEDPQLPPLTKIELDNFEINYPHFTTKYKCRSKLYTRKQFNLMRKANR